jgi:hypothetical protein
MLKGDAIHAENTWVTLSGSVKEPGVTSPPKLTRMAYWNNMALASTTGTTAGSWPCL